MPLFQCRLTLHQRHSFRSIPTHACISLLWQFWLKLLQYFIMEKPAQDRKRKASTALREVASELQVANRGRNNDLTKQQFNSILELVESHGSITAAQRRRVQEAKALYFASPTLPPIPGLPGLAPGPPASSAAPTPPASVPQPVLPVDSSGDSQKTPFRLRGTSCLFTYNSTSFSDMGSAQVWNLFLAFLRSLKFVFRWTATLETSLRSAHGGRVHLHAFMEFTSEVDWTSTTRVAFQGIRPNAKPTVARGKSQKDTVNQGHFYVWAWKKGTQFVETSGWEPWLDYTVKGWWIDELWSAHKLEHDEYLEYAAQVRIGYINRLKHVQALQEREKAVVLKDRQQAVALRLAPLKNQFHPDVLRMLQTWLQQYRLDLDRYNFLVLRGVSRSGKSTLAKALGHMFGLGKPYVQTVQDAEAPDLKAWSDEFGYIVFDNVNHMKFVLAQRALFQSNNDMHTLADSRTGIYSYSVWLYKVPIVVTVDMSATWDEKEAWISANCNYVFLGGPCYL